MNRFTAIFCAGALALAAGLLSGGCQKGDAGDGGTKVAVYDIDRVAHDLGWATDMQSNMDGLKKKFEEDLAHSKEQYTQQIINQKKQWAPKDTDKLTPDQQQILNSMNSYASQVLNQLNQNGVQQLGAYRQQWIIQYHQALRPILEQVAEERKLAMIFEKNDSIQYSQPSSDITDAITDAARAHPPVINPVQVPQLPNPGPMTIKWPDTQPTSKPAQPAAPAAPAPQ